MKEKLIRLLICEKDQNLALMLADYLNGQGFDCTVCGDGEDAAAALANTKYDLCLTEVNLPRKDGFMLVKEVKEVNSFLPVVFLTERSSIDDILTGYRLGCEDYVTKPFSLQVLRYKLKAIVRRIYGPAEDHPAKSYRIGRLMFDRTRRMLLYEDRAIQLTTKEADLLTALCMKQGELLERGKALKNVWSEDNYYNARSMDVYITRLRKHLALDPEVRIANIHGKGYKLIVPY